MKNTYHRWFAVTAFLLGVLPVAGIADHHREDGERFVVAFAQDTMGNDWRVAQVQQMAQAFEAYPNIRFIYSDAKGQSARQIKDIENFVYQNVDVLITSPRDSLAATLVVTKAFKQGIPVVMITRNITSDDYTTYVAPDDYEIAKNAADYMAEALNEKGKVLMLRGIPTASTAKARTKGFMNQIKKYPNVEVVAIKDANYLRADAIRAIEEVLNEDIEFDAIYSQSDSMAAGARLALRKAGIDPKDKLIVGIDYIAEARDAIRNKEQAASFLYPTSAAETAEVVVKILHGKVVPKRVLVESILVTSDNVESVEPIF